MRFKYSLADPLKHCLQVIGHKLNDTLDLAPIGHLSWHVSILKRRSIEVYAELCLVSSSLFT